MSKTKITLEEAEIVAKKMTSFQKIEIESIKDKINDFAIKCLIKITPPEINAIKDNVKCKNFIKTTQSLYIQFYDTESTTDGYRVYLNEQICYDGGNLILDYEKSKVFKELVYLIKNKKSELNKLIDNIVEILRDLSSYSAIAKNLPEAAPFLNNDIKSYDKIRSQLKLSKID